MNKHKEQPLDITQPVELHMTLDNGQPFIVSGAYESLVDVMATTEAYDATLNVRKQKVSVPLVKAVVAAPEQPEVLDGRRATVAAKLYDLTNRTNLYDILKQQRQDEHD